MIIAAICFLVYELYKLLHPKKVDEAIKTFARLREKRTTEYPETFWLRLGGMAILEFLYMAWCIIGVIFFPEWRLVLGCLLALAVLKSLLPKTKGTSSTPKLVAIDSAVSAAILLVGIIYMTREYWGDFQ